MVSKKIIEKSIDYIYGHKKIMCIIDLPKKIKLIRKNLTRNEIKIIHEIGIFGWATYTYYDQIRDRDNGGGDKKYLSIGNLMMSDFYFLISKIIKNNIIIKKLIQNMEEANLFEEIKSNRKITDTYILKSIGAAIPMIILLIKAEAGKKNIDACYNYFYHLIGARQLSDDAYDWPEDMKKGHRTLVTEWFKEAAGNGKSIMEYRKFSNDIVAPKVDNKILWHARKSIEYAKQMTCFKSTEPLEELPRFYEDMATKLIAKRKDKKLKKKIPK
jgi:hypothetical protein